MRGSSASRNESKSKRMNARAISVTCWTSSGANAMLHREISEMPSRYTTTRNTPSGSRTSGVMETRFFRKRMA